MSRKYVTAANVVAKVNGTPGYQIPSINWTCNNQVLLNNQDQIPIAQTMVVNGDFSQGSTGRTLGAGARVRPQGWVLKRGPIVDSVMSGNFPCSSGQPVYGVFAVNNSDSGATLRPYITFRDSGGASVGGTLQVTASPGPGWQILTISGTTPVGTANARIELFNNGQTSGTSYFGFAYVTINGSVIVTNWDFADGTTGWTLTSDDSITYDPANAYMGNSFDGTPRNTLVISGDADYSYQTMFFPAVSGNSYKFSATWKKLIDPSTAMDRPKIHWYSGPSFAYTFLGAAEVPNISSGNFQTTEISAVAPDGATYGAIILADAAVNDGLWFIGQVNVQRLINGYWCNAGESYVPMVASQNGNLVEVGDAIIPEFANSSIFSASVETVSTYQSYVNVANQYLAYQLSGELVQDTVNAQEEHYYDIDNVLNFFANLSIDTADEYYTEKIGQWIGYTRPLCPAGIWDENSFTYTDLSNQGNDSLTGYGSLTLGPDGGGYISISSAFATKMPLTQYKLALKQFAYIKWNGLSLYTLDRLAKIFGDDYVFLFANSGNFFTYTNTANPGMSSDTGYGTTTPNQPAGRYYSSQSVVTDIVIMYNTNIGTGNAYLLQNVINHFATEPAIFVSIGS